MKPGFYSIILINMIRSIRYSLILILAMTIASSFSAVASGTIETVSYQQSPQSNSAKLNIYLPPGYHEAASKDTFYSVFYLLHGYGGNHSDWAGAGDLNSALDGYITSKKSVPMIVVMPDCRDLAPELFSKELINEIIPYVEKHYRVIKDSDHRGVGGLSWGGLQALDAGIYHYDLFGYVVIMSSGWFATDTAAYEKLKTFIAANNREIEKSNRYFYFGEGTKDDVAYSNGQLTLNVLKVGGLTVHYWEHPGGHSWTTWKADLMDAAPYLFRSTDTRYVALDFQGGNIGNSTIMTTVNRAISIPMDPTRNGYTFGGWYKEPDCKNRYDFTQKVKNNMTLYAKWINK